MTWGFPPEVEETIKIEEDPETVSKKILSAVGKFNWEMELQEKNYLYFTRKQKYRLCLFFLKNERTDIVVRINENNTIIVRSCGPNFICDGGANKKNISNLLSAIAN